MRGAPARRCYLREEQTTVTDSRHYWQRGKFYGVRKITVLILKFSKDPSQAKSEIGREEEKVKVSPLIFYSRLSPGYRPLDLPVCRLPDSQEISSFLETFQSQHLQDLPLEGGQECPVAVFTSSWLIPFSFVSWAAHETTGSQKFSKRHQ